MQGNPRSDTNVQNPILGGQKLVGFRVGTSWVDHNGDALHRSDVCQRISVVPLFEV